VVPVLVRGPAAAVGAHGGAGRRRGLGRVGLWAGVGVGSG